MNIPDHNILNSKIIVFEKFLSAKTVKLGMKFNSNPINTNTMLEYVDKSHTPWLTICPNPGVHFKQLEALYNDYMKLGPEPELKQKKLPAFGAEPVDFGMLAHVAARTGGDLGTLVGQVLMPPWMQHIECKIVTVANKAGPGAGYYSTSSCNLLKDPGQGEI
jgi:hypothetical protein